MGQCYCYSIKDNAGGNNQGAIDLKELFINSNNHSRNYGYTEEDRGGLNNKNSDKSSSDSDEEMDDWEGAIYRSSQKGTVRKSMIVKQRRRAIAFDLKIIISDEMLRKENKGELVSPRVNNK